MEWSAITEEAIELLTHYGLGVIGAIVLLIVGRIAAGIGRKMTVRALGRSNADPALIPFFSKATYYLIWAVVLIGVLGLFGIQTTSLVAVLGAAGLAVGLALQGTLSHFAAGVMLLIFRPFTIGDYVEAGGAAGSIEEIGLFGRLAAGNEMIDGYIFGAQSDDVSEGREYDGAETWTFFTEPTPGSSNGEPVDAPAMGVTELRMLPAYPNPFNPKTTLCFELPVSGSVLLEIYDIGGRRVSALISESLAAGRHEIVWDGRDQNGTALAAGVYLSRLVFDGEVQTERLVLLK